MPVLRSNVSGTNGNLNTRTAGYVQPGTAIAMGNLKQRITALSCLVTVTAETNTLTLTPGWQVSHDNSTWYDVAPPNNPANVALATGTSSADPAVSKVVAAPEAVYGWEYARCVIVTGVVTGAATDLYAFAYNCRLTDV
jgi:hypothetical protein